MFGQNKERKKILEKRLDKEINLSIPITALEFG